ncbi:MAG TPA: polyphosphate kinase 2 family protein [Actinomycetota bacterium]|jgi:PPK2 family polyphosphate:nucleotide phosphotransferase|nr:polyphosphate kinase 2 family protein [Actinomycetota bacterium]TXH43052.1 MAG: polyphosphate kinase 2 family protein [Actinomycetota bacterium]HNE89033.1 polyphosphate kinase 2 family protein [Actinomycetota bacterium]HNO16562.1 polyphosphate kinase 2 family protein [Actinomycetota bacterium]
MAMAKDVLEQLRVDPGEKFRIADHDAKWLPPAAHEVDKAERKRIAEMMLADNKVELAEAQELLYADGRHSVLIVFQAMDAAGKDGTIGHVMSGVNPQGCSVSSFKVPSAEEFSHTYLWRYSKALPARGMIGIFNRSYYEEVLVVKVHPAILDKADLPPEDVHKDIWKHRYEDINNFEQHLSRNGTTILKFFLNVSKEEQKKRFLERLDTPEKNWKFSSGDIVERGYWDDYMAAFEDAINATSTPWAPWYVIPADHKWAMRAAVSDIITTTIKDLPLEYPKLPEDEVARLAEAKAKLLAEQ